jgi:hypothetical protein
MQANAISHRRTGSHCRDRVIHSAADPARDPDAYYLCEGA